MTRTTKRRTFIPVPELGRSWVTGTAIDDILDSFAPVETALARKRRKRRQCSRCGKAGHSKQSCRS